MPLVHLFCEGSGGFLNNGAAQCMETAKPERSNGNAPVNVLEIIGTATKGGMEIHIAGMLKNLPSEKFRVTCICPCESPFTNTLRQLGVEAVYTTPLADNPEWRSIQTAMQVAKLHNIDLLHAHMPKSHVLAGIAGSLLHKPVVATLHGMHVTPHELGVAKAVRSTLITNCQETYMQALALGVSPKRLHLFQNGVDTATFAPAASSMILREKIGVPPGAKLVAFIGRLEHEKGPDLFLRAADVVHQQLPAVHFVVIGSGSMLPYLQKMRRHLQLEKHLHFVDWTENPAAVYADIDLLAHSSRSDGTSLVLLEAMACGKPVVGMAVGGVREMIANEYTGMQVEANDWQMMGMEMIKLLKKPAMLKAMGAAARLRVEEHFDVKVNTAKTAQLLWQTGMKFKDSPVSQGITVPLHSRDNTGIKAT